MKNKFLISVLFVALFGFMSFSFAASIKTVTLAVEGMTCGTCPITVKMALKKVDGVMDVTAKYEGSGQGWAKVSYDADKADVDDLTFATEEAGYPSALK